MKNVFNKVLIQVLLSGMVVSGPVMANSATMPIPSANSQLKPNGLDRHKMFQDQPKIVAAQDSRLHTVSQITKSTSINLSQNGLWLTEKGISINAQQLIHAIENASNHGLNPEAYGLSYIVRMTDSLLASSKYTSNSSTQVVVFLSRDIELLRTNLSRELNTAFIQLSEHLGQGVVDARAVQRRLFRESPTINAHALLDALTAGTHSVESALNSVVPTHLEYRRLTGKMRDLLMDRARAGLNPDLADEIKAVALSLERWRWMPRDLGSKHVLVNIPEYQVRVRSDSQTVLSMDVVVGSVKYQTPGFSQDMSYIEFNPTWTVPQSIANRDLIPIERKKPGYLASRNFDILKRDGERLLKVPHEQVTAADLAQDTFPYILKQRGGPGNALGKVKFMMPNPYSIYLHDTPTKKHFALDDRAYSNGCIRLSEPDQLARLLMQEDGYTEQEISAALSSVATTRINLRTPIPTHMTYLTTWVDKNNLLHRHADVYSYDAALADALQASDTLLSIIMALPIISANTSS